MTHPDSTTNAGAVEALREAIDAGLKAFCSCTPDFTMSSAMRRDAADFIMAQPGTFRATPTPASEAEVPAGWEMVPIEARRIYSAILSPTKEPRDD